MTCRTRLFPSVAIVLVFLCLVAASRPAEASCGVARKFSTKNPDYGDHYIYTPGYPFYPDQSISNYALGFFWSFLGANKTVGIGNDDGLNFGSPFPAVYGGQSAEDWWDSTGSKSFIGSGTAPEDGFHNWSIAGIDGCIDNDGSDNALLDTDQCMFVLLGDDPDGFTGYFVLLADSPRAGNYEFNEGLVDEEPIMMAPVPQPQVTYRNRTSRTELEVRVSVPQMIGEVPGLYDENCGQGRTWPLGYKIYTQQKPRIGPTPAFPFGRNVSVKWPDADPDRPDAPWNDSGTGTTTLGTETTLMEFDCDPTSGGGDHIFVCGILAFEGGYDTPYCSSDLVIECGGDPLANVDTADDASIAGVAVQFTEAIDPVTVNNGTIMLSAASYSVTATDATTATITPSPLLDFDTDYTVTVTNGITDFEFNQVAPESIAIRTENRPGGVDKLEVNKTVTDDIKLEWDTGSCEPDDGEFGIYRGTMAALKTGSYDHVGINCSSSSGVPYEQIVTPAGVDSYYLVVPQASTVEGSYGSDLTVADRSLTTDCVEGNQNCICSSPGVPATCFCEAKYTGDGVSCSSYETRTERPVGTGCSKPQEPGGCRPWLM